MNATANMWNTLNDLFESDDVLEVLSDETGGRFIERVTQLTSPEQIDVLSIEAALGKFIELAMKAVGIMDHDMARVAAVLRDKPKFGSLVTPAQMKTAIEDFENSKEPDLEFSVLIASVYLILKAGERFISGFEIKA